MHPLAALETNYKRLLAKELTQTIEKTIEHIGTAPLTIRSQSFTSAELRTLSKAARFEPIEPNPYLGLRGGLKALSQPEWLKFELEIIQKIQAKTATQLSFLLPFIRTPTELARLARTVAEYLPATAKHKPLWFELATPASVFSLTEYALQDVGGLVIRFEQLHALLLGYDPTNPEISVNYPTTLAQLELILKQVTSNLAQAVVSQELKTPPALRLQLDTYNSQYIELAVRFGLEGVIVSPKTLVLAKNSILETEARALQKSTNALA
jgi:pyruvate,water dikinase